jgi:hypothetical protein
MLDISGYSGLYLKNSRVMVYGIYGHIDIFYSTIVAQSTYYKEISIMDDESIRAYQVCDCFELQKKSAFQCFNGHLIRTRTIDATKPNSKISIRMSFCIIGTNSLQTCTFESLLRWECYHLYTLHCYLVSSFSELRVNP